jgi:blocked-early-in-transport protein 1
LQSVDFDKTGGLMTGTMRRLEGLVKYGGGSGHMCKLVLFIIALFFLLWFLVGRR